MKDITNETVKNPLKRNSRKIDSIDVAKFVGSILIFAMHNSALRDYGFASKVLEIMTRWGVPFFFISSSYFLFRKNINGKTEKIQIIQYTYRISRLYVCWCIFNLPSVFYIRLYGKNLLSISTWLGFFKNSILSSTFTGSWYLVSSIFSAWIIYNLSKKVQTNKLILITSVPYILCVFTSSWKGVLPSGITTCLLFLCFPLNIFNGCFYFALGKYIAEKENDIIKAITMKKALCLFMISYSLYALELYLSKLFGFLTSTDVAFSTAALAFTLFLFCIQIKRNFKYGLLLRKLSIIIFCCQGNVIIANGICRTVLGIPSFVSFLISVLIVIIISIITLLVQQKKQWKWTQYLT